MTQADQIQQDLHFVRAVVSRREAPRRGPAGAYYVWAAYVFIGYLLTDAAQHYAGWFFALAAIPAAILSMVFSKQWSARRGEFNRASSQKALLHWLGGGVIAVGCTIAMSLTHPNIPSQVDAQFGLVLIGMVYFLGGVSMDRSFLWIGPLVMAGGIAVGFMPHYGWTALGTVIALALVAAGLIASRSTPTISEQVQ